MKTTPRSILEIRRTPSYSSSSPFLLPLVLSFPGNTADTCNFLDGAVFSPQSVTRTWFLHKNVLRHPLFLFVAARKDVFFFGVEDLEDLVTNRRNYTFLLLSFRRRYLPPV